MTKHFLALNIIDTYNPKVLTILDESEYSSELPIDCARLKIFPPGFNTPVFIDETPGFNIRLSACALNLQRSKCGELQADLPDGIYIINYSVSPLDKVFIEYNYLRITGIMNALRIAQGNVLLQPCTPMDDMMEQLEELQLIEDFINAAKISVEDHHKPKIGIDLLTYAKNRLDKLLNKTCSHC